MKGGPLHSILLWFSLPWQPLMNVHAIRLSLCLFAVEEWRGPVLGIWKKQGELRHPSLAMEPLSGGVETHRAPDPLDPLTVLIFKHRWDLLFYPFSSCLGLTATTLFHINSRASEQMNGSIAIECASIWIKPTTKSKASAVRVSMTNQLCLSLRATQIQDVWFVWPAKSVFALSAGHVALCGLTQQGGAEGWSL